MKIACSAARGWALAAQVSAAWASAAWASAVWALVYPPSYEPPETGEDLEAESVPRVELADPAARLPEQRYQFRRAVDE